MSADNYWKYYRNIPVPVANLSVSPMPVRLQDWEHFSVHIHYFKICNDLLRKRLKLDESVLVFDYIVSMLLQTSDDLESDDPEHNKTQEFAQVLSYCFRLPVEPLIRRKNGRKDMVFRINGNDNDLITRDNYEEVREMIMEQNYIFEPIIAPNQKSQELIDKAIARMANSGSDTEMNLESMLCLVSRVRDIDDENYTYYQLRIDYEMELRLEQSHAIPIYRSVGADVPSIELGEVMSSHTNPYSKEKLFKRNDRTKDSTMLRN